MKRFHCINEIGNPQDVEKSACIVRAAESAQKDALMAQRCYQSGKLEQLKSGEWRLRWRRWIIDEKGKKRRKQEKTRLGFHASKRLARRAADELLEPVNSRDYRPGKVITLEEFSEKWTRDASVLEQEGSQKSSKSHLKVHLLPMLGDEKLENIHQHLVQSMVASLATKKPGKKPLRQKTVLNILGTLGNMMRYAKDWGYTVGTFDRNRLKIPSEDLASPERMFTEEETVNIINAAQGKYKAMFCIVAMTGMRCGEVLGLRWSDVDLAARVITARQQCWNGRLKVLKSKKGRRLEHSMPIPTPLEEILRWYKDQWKANDHDLLFASHPAGKPLWANSVLRNTLHPLTDSLGIPRGAFHAFRHEMASLLVSTGANPKVTQAQLGHADVRTTMGVYARVLHNDHREAVEKVAQILRPDAPSDTRKVLRIQ